MINKDNIIYTMIWCVRAVTLTWVRGARGECCAGCGGGVRSESLALSGARARLTTVLGVVDESDSRPKLPLSVSYMSRVGRQWNVKATVMNLRVITSRNRAVHDSAGKLNQVVMAGVANGR